VSLKEFFVIAMFGYEIKFQLFITFRIVCIPYMGLGKSLNQSFSFFIITQRIENTIACIAHNLF